MPVRAAFSRSRDTSSVEVRRARFKRAGNSPERLSVEIYAARISCSETVASKTNAIIKRRTSSPKVPRGSSTAVARSRHRDRVMRIT